MAEYIEREAVIELITSRYENPEICTAEINSIPAADVAPVVLCCACKHSKENKDTVTVFCSAFMRDMRGHDFCSYGEKSTDNSTDL